MSRSKLISIVWGVGAMASAYASFFIAAFPTNLLLGKIPDATWGMVFRFGIVPGLIIGVPAALLLLSSIGWLEMQQKRRAFWCIVSAPIISLGIYFAWDRLA